MSQYPYRSLPPEPTANPRQLPPATPQPPVRRSLGSYFHFVLWRTLIQQAARHRYWMKGGAIAYGVICSVLLGGLALLAIASLKTSVQTAFLSAIAFWLPDWASAIEALMQEVSTTWSTFHRWSLLLISAGVGLALWLKVVGLTQHIIRSDGDLASHLMPSLRQRLLTMGVAIATAGLGVLAVLFVLVTLPGSGAEAIATASPLFVAQRLFMHLLRWGLALSTTALVFGLLYRSSQKSTAKMLPILPGTILAALCWMVTGLGLKLFFNTLGSQHWLLSLFSTLILLLLGLYICILGLLLGGQYNKLVHRYFPQPRSRPLFSKTPPPSFESFTIQKRPYR